MEICKLLIYNSYVFCKFLVVHHVVSIQVRTHRYFIVSELSTLYSAMLYMLRIYLSLETSAISWPCSNIHLGIIRKIKISSSVITELVAHCPPLLWLIADFNSLFRIWISGGLTLRRVYNPTCGIDHWADFILAHTMSV